MKVFREELYGTNIVIDIFIGSTPSFFYLLGLMSLVAIFSQHLKLHSVLKTSFLLMLGALIYEIEQYWSSRTFDLYDVLATLLAFFVFLLVHIENFNFKKYKSMSSSFKK